MTNALGHRLSFVDEKTLLTSMSTDAVRESGTGVPARNERRLEK